MGSSTATYYVNHDLKVCYAPTRKSYECTAPGYTPEPANHEEDNCCQLHEAYKTIDEQNGSAADQRYVLPCQEEGDQARYDCPCTENAQSSQNIPSLIQCLYYHSVFEKTATHFSNLKVFVCSLCQLFPYLWISVCPPWQNIFSRLLEFNTTSYTKHHFLSDLYQQSTFNEWLFGEMTAPVFVGNVILSNTIPDCLLSFPCSSFLLTVHTNYS